MEVSPQLRLARRILLVIPGFDLLTDFVYYPGTQGWAIRFRITCPVAPNAFIGEKTNWYAVVSAAYPWGSIKIYPDKEGGITHTFPHQDYNCPSEKYPWREGDICVSTSLIKWGRTELVEEPFEEDKRLQWHVMRTIGWIQAAAAGRLMEVGDPFELPQYPNTSILKLGFNEDSNTFNKWLEAGVMMGMATILKLKSNDRLLYLKGYELDKERDLAYHWGEHFIKNTATDYDAVWIRLEKIPVLLPWQLPATWRELFEVVGDQKMDLKEMLTEVYLRNKKRKIRFVILGFPIQDLVGSEACRMHWLCLAVDAVPAVNGYMDVSARTKQGLSVLFAPGKKLRWLPTENWSAEQITSRGTLRTDIAQKNILLIGAGAVGSLFAEGIIRLGCHQLTIVDEDMLGMGNLSRHTLTIEDVQRSKAEQLAERLNAIFPFVVANFHNDTIESLVQKNPGFLAPYDLIIDATGSDEVVSRLNEFFKEKDKLFISLSVGIQARRLFAYISPTLDRDVEMEFRGKLSPWLQKERAENTGLKLGREGIGCWHPIFPARIDDVQMLLHSFIKVLESGACDSSDSKLIIVEKQTDENGGFQGLHILYE